MLCTAPEICILGPHTPLARILRARGSVCHRFAMVLESVPGLAAWFRGRGAGQGQGQAVEGDGSGDDSPSVAAEWRKAAKVLMAASYICSTG